MSSIWIQKAEKLSLGTKTRIPCCSTDNSRIISHTVKGYSSYCFRCGADSAVFKPKGELGLQELREYEKRLQELKNSCNTQVQLPFDYTQAIPIEHCVWLFKYGITEQEIKQFKIGYSKYYDRVVLPVYYNNKLRVVQMRSINTKPKYYNIGGTDSVLVIRNTLSDTVVVVEDILSAIKVSRVCNAVSTLGTNLNFSKATKILKVAKKGFIWYDADEAGIKGCKMGLINLNMQGGVFKSISSDLDPKEYTTQAINNYINTG